MALTGHDSLLRRFAAMRREKNEVETLVKELQTDLIRVFREQGEHKAQVELRSQDGPVELANVSLVSQRRATIDQDRLKKALGAKLWKKVTKKVLDDDKLEALMINGEVDPMVVAACTDEKIVEFCKVSFKKKPQ